MNSRCACDQKRNSKLIKSQTREPAIMAHLGTTFVKGPHRDQGLLLQEGESNLNGSSTNNLITTLIGNKGRVVLNI